MTPVYQEIPTPAIASGLEAAIEVGAAEITRFIGRLQPRP